VPKSIIDCRLGDHHTKEEIQMATSFIVMKHGVKTNITSQGKKTALAHGNPAGEGKGIGKFSTKVRTSGPVSDSNGRNH